MKESLRQITLRAMVATYGLTEGSSKAFGKTIRCMERELSSGAMAANTKESMSTRKRKATESLLGQTEDATKDSGKTASRTVRESTAIRKELRELVFGPMVKKLNGLIDKFM